MTPKTLSPAPALSKMVDTKGRLTLGKQFAGRTVLIETLGEGELRVSLAELVPAREAWLYKNPEARVSVSRGLRQARAGRFAANAPDLTADLKRLELDDPEDA